MNKKNKMSIRRKIRPIVSLTAVVAVTMIMIMTMTTKPCTFGIALAQDLNPPTTGRTSPNVTSTFGPNMPGTAANGSSIASNVTEGIRGNSTG